MMQQFHDGGLGLVAGDVFMNYSYVMYNLLFFFFNILMCLRKYGHKDAGIYFINPRLTASRVAYKKLNCR